MGRSGASPRVDGIAAVHPTGQRSERLLRLLQLARGDGQQSIDGQGESFFEPDLLLELVAAEPEGRARAGRHVGFEKLNIRRHRFGGLHLPVGQIPEQMQIIDARKGPGQVLLDELQRPAHRLEPHLHEDAGRVLDVVASGLNQAGCLAQLGCDAASSFGRRGVRKQGLAGQARRQYVRVRLRVFLPRPYLFEVEHPGPDVRRRAFDAPAARCRSDCAGSISSRRRR